jgi:cytochrome c biogenesis protein CcdA
MDYILAYGAGLLTLINPCILPVLPIVLATSLQASRAGPLALAAGMSFSFVVLGLLVASVGHAVGLREETVAQASAVMMMAFGLVLVVPRLSAGFATATAGFSARADAGMDRVDRDGLGGQFLGGALLGAVWSPCIGPTLGGAVALAAQGEQLVQAGAIMAAFALGVSTLIIGLGFGARSAILKRQGSLRALASRARPIMGLTFLVVGTALFFGLHYRIEIWMLDNMPYWLQDLSVSL